METPSKSEVRAVVSEKLLLNLQRRTRFSEITTYVISSLGISATTPLERRIEEIVHEMLVSNILMEDYGTLFVMHLTTVSYVSIFFLLRHLSLLSLSAVPR